MSIIAYPLEATEYTAEDVQSYLSTRTSGVYSEDITFTPEGMTVTVSPFLAWFNYAKFKGCSVAVTEPETLTFSPAHAVFDRIDRIVLRLDFTVNKSYFTIVEGTPSSSPVPGDINKTEAVNDISPVYVRIKAGATEITPADITSTILDESVCGIMRDGVTGIPTSQLQEQAEALILRLHDAISGVESGSAFMMSDLYDPNNKAKPVAFDDETYKIDGQTSTTGTIARFCDDTLQLLSIETLTQILTTLANPLNNRAINLHKTNPIEKAFYFQETVDGQDKTYMAFGEHNKPSGTYVGNGSEKSRTVQIGGLSNKPQTVIIASNNGFAIVHGLRGSIVKTGETLEGLRVTQASVSSGVLALATTNICLNKNGTTYEYFVL